MSICFKNKTKLGLYVVGRRQRNGRGGRRKWRAEGRGEIEGEGREEEEGEEEECGNRNYTKSETL